MQPKKLLRERDPAVGPDTVVLFAWDEWTELTVVGCSCPTDAGTPLVPQKAVAVYLGDATGAVLALRVSWSRAVGKGRVQSTVGMLVEITRDSEGKATAQLEECFVHSKYPCAVTNHSMLVTVAGQQYGASLLGQNYATGRVVDMSAICRLLAGIMSEEDFLASAEGETVAKKLVRLEAEYAWMQDQLEHARHTSTTAMRDRDL